MIDKVAGKRLIRVFVPSLWMISVMISVFGLSGCSGMNVASRELIDEIVIRNETSDSVLDVVLLVPRTHMIVKTNQILPYREYSLKFSVTKNRREDATLSWTHRQRRYTRPIHTLIPADVIKSVPSKVVIRIGQDGRVTSRIESI